MLQQRHRSKTEGTKSVMLSAPECVRAMHGVLGVGAWRGARSFLLIHPVHLHNDERTA